MHCVLYACFPWNRCGSKVGATVLSSVMNRLRAGGLLTVPPAVKKDILVGLDSPDDAAVIRPPAGPGRVTVHTVDFFRCFLDDPYVFGQVAANHALSDCHAMCADAHTALVCPSLYVLIPCLQVAADLVFGRGLALRLLRLRQ